MPNNRRLFVDITLAYFVGKLPNYKRSIIVSIIATPFSFLFQNDSNRFFVLWKDNYWTTSKDGEVGATTWLCSMLHILVTTILGFWVDVQPLLEQDWVDMRLSRWLLEHAMLKQQWTMVSHWFLNMAGAINNRITRSAHEERARATMKNTLQKVYVNISVYKSSSYDQINHAMFGLYCIKIIWKDLETPKHANKE